MPANKKHVGLEISSDQLTEQLIEIKERISALETIASLANRIEVAAYVAETLNSDHAKKIMAACSEPRTKEQLRLLGGFNSVQALDNHLKHLRSDALVEQRTNEKGLITIEWSPLFKRLPNRDRERLTGPQHSAKTKKA
jgi:cAMP phosphodiesterase